MDPLVVLPKLQRRILQILFLAALQENFIQGQVPSQTYDFIVVGAGTAGCSVAGHLSENGKYTVLLLEAGGVPHPELDVPALTARHRGNPEYSRVYSTVPQANAGLESGGILNYLVGRTLGGTSSINGMFMNRGSPYDYDNWSRILDDPSWKYSNMLKYFKKSENYNGIFPSDQHGYRGPISVSRGNYAPGLDTWIQAGQSLGYPILDPNGPQRISFSPPEFSMRFGTRVSSFTGYIKPHLQSRRNLKVLISAVVQKIEFQGDRAVGVHFTINSAEKSHPYFALARKEIILSAGVIESPVLLMKSGVGPKAVLEAGKIPPIKFLESIGQNLQDHVFVKMDFLINDTSQVFQPQRDLTPPALQLYRETGDGPYSSYNGFVGQAFVASSTAKHGETGNWADLEFIAIHSPGGNSSDDELLSQSDDINGISDRKVMISCMVYLGRPKSCGQITLNATHANNDPLIDFRYFTNPQDLEVTLEGVKMALKLYENTAPYQRLGAKFFPGVLPACDHLHFRTDSYWRCFIKQRTLSGFHGSGTCKMGRALADPEAVIDSNFRVIGIANLRVVDASVMPTIVNTNLEAGIYGISEKASDVILQNWKGSSEYLKTRFSKPIPMLFNFWHSLGCDKC